MSTAESEETVLTTSLGHETLADTIELLQCAARETRFHLGQDGLDSKVVDPANVMMVDISLAPRAFELTPSGSYTVGVNLQSIEDYTSKADADQSIDFSFNAKNRKLNVTYANKDLNVACIDPDAIRAEPDLPDLDHPNTVTVDVEDLRDAFELCNMMSDHIGLHCDPDAGELIVSAEGDTDDVTVEFGRDETLDPTKLTEATGSLFSADYLIDGTDSYSGLFEKVPDGEVTLQLGDEMPVIIDFEYADGAGEVTALVAPRI